MSVTPLSPDAATLFALTRAITERLATAQLAPWERETLADELVVLAQRALQPSAAEPPDVEERSAAHIRVEEPL